MGRDGKTVKDRRNNPQDYPLDKKQVDLDPQANSTRNLLGPRFAKV
jgi:hypothetical protein